MTNMDEQKQIIQVLIEIEGTLYQLGCLRLALRERLFRLLEVEKNESCSAQIVQQPVPPHGSNQGVPKE